MRKSKKTEVTPRKRPEQERSRTTVAHILAASTQILQQQGLEFFNTNKVAQKAGISIGSLYQYFPNKEAIISALLERYVQKQFELIETEMQKMKGKNLRTTIAALVKVQLESKKKNSRFNKFIAETLFRIDGLKHMQKIDDKIADYLKQFVLPFKDELRDGDIDWMIFNMIHIMKILPVSVIFHPTFEIEDPKFEEELVELFFGYLKKRD
jgi:AcrR family transcriptional regulator